MGIISYILNSLLSLLQLVIFINAIISWLPVPRDSQWVQLLTQISEPVLMPIRNMMNRFVGQSMLTFDISPIIAIALLQILKGIIARIF